MFLLWSTLRRTYKSYFVFSFTSAGKIEKSWTTTQYFDATTHSMHALPTSMPLIHTIHTEQRQRQAKFLNHGDDGDITFSFFFISIVDFHAFLVRFEQEAKVLSHKCQCWRWLCLRLGHHFVWNGVETRRLIANDEHTCESQPSNRQQ